jgi:hypothetical protein
LLLLLLVAAFAGEVWLAFRPRAPRCDPDLTPLPHVTQACPCAGEEVVEDERNGRGGREMKRKAAVSWGDSERRRRGAVSRRTRPRGIGEGSFQTCRDRV